MGKRLEVFRKVLFGSGVAAVLIGLATIVYALGFLGSRVSSLAVESSQSLTVVQRGLTLLESTAAAFETSPEVLDHMEAVMRQSATTLRASAVTMREVGGTGIVIPEESLDANASALDETATELDRLIKDFGEIRRGKSDLDMSTAREFLVDLRAQLGETEEALSQAPVARGVVFLTILQGGIYILLGALAMALSGEIGRVGGRGSI